jgi:hypothetical protein
MPTSISAILGYEVADRLVVRWSQDENGGYPYPTLRGMTVVGDPGLRGIRSLDVSLRYPITAICGRNGAVSGCHLTTSG